MITCLPFHRSQVEIALSSVPREPEIKVLVFGDSIQLPFFRTMIRVENKKRTSASNISDDRDHNRLI